MDVVQRIGACLSIGAFAFAVPAHAEALFRPPPGVTDVVPADGADIPTNARIVVFAGVDPTALTVTRVHADASRELLDVDSSLTGVFIVDPGAITIGDDVVIEPGCATCVGVFTFHAPFPDDVIPPVLQGGTEIEPGTATDLTDGNPIFPQRAGYEIGFVIPRVHDASGPVFIDFKADEGREVFVPAGSSETGDFSDPGTGVDAGDTRIHTVVDGPEERTLCADVVAVDVAGNETPFPDRACVELKHTAEGAGFGGCASTSPSTTSFGALAVAIAFARRRRRRR